MRATMDVNLKIQKLGRMMLRLDEAPAAAFAFSDQVDGFALVPNVFRKLPSHILATSTSAGARRAIPVGPKAAVLSVEDRFRRWAHEEPTRLPRHQSRHLRPLLIRRHSCPRPSSVGHPKEGVLAESCLGRTVSSRPSIIPGRQGYPITSMKVQKVHLRHAKAFAPDHVMRKRISCHWCAGRHQAGIRLL